MVIKQSETLQGYLRIGSAEAKRTGRASLAADIALLAMARDQRTHAGRILRHLLKDWELYSIKERVEKEAAKEVSKGKELIPGGDILTLVEIGIETVRAEYDPDGVANTGHFLLWMARNTAFPSSRALEMYGVTASKVAEVMEQMPGEEDDHVRKASEESITIEKLARLVRQVNSEDSEDTDMTGQPVKVKSKKDKSSMIGLYGTNLTESARAGSIDTVVGREKEIERLVQILGRRKKNNPILVGEAGVGKSAIVEGLALRMAAGDIPYALRGKEIYSLDIASLVAGTKYRGEFEERMKDLLDELTEDKNIILFIDEIHTIVGAGSSQGSLDTANILKPALARGELQCIGATTLDEYRENIEKDSALERRFQKIVVEPTTAEQTLQILHNIKGHYEKHHAVRYTDEALEACVSLTGRYVTDRNFPDKAIDALDEAGSKARLSDTEPEAFSQLENAIGEALTERKAAMKEVEYDKAALARIKAMSLQSRLEECRGDWLREMEENPVVIDAPQIEQVITTMTGIPVEKVSQDEKARLAGMQTHLSRIVIGQDKAVAKVVSSIQRSRAGLKDPGKPIGVFMFVGPTGVGKTHLAKELSKWMFDRPDALIRIDMSEYSEKHNVSRMIGSPPGYVGYGEGGQLTEAVRRQPYAVVLFDEIEKAHPDVFNVMLQIFDEGCLTDGLGRKVDFRNTVIIMTSNVGSRKVESRPPSVGYLRSGSDEAEKVVRTVGYRDALLHTFAPEFINRIDDIVVFNTLPEDDVVRIVDIELAKLTARVTAGGYKLKVAAKAKKELAALGYEPRYGVRSLRRVIQEHVEEPVAGLIISGEANPGDTIKIECRKEGLTASVTNNSPNHRAA